MNRSSKESTDLLSRDALERQLRAIDVSLLGLLREIWSETLPNGVELLSDGGLCVHIDQPIEIWFPAKSDLHKLLQKFGQNRGSCILTAQTRAQPDLTFIIENDVGSAKAQLTCDLQLRLQFPVNIESSTRIGLRLSGPLTLRWLTLHIAFPVETIKPTTGRTPVGSTNLHAPISTPHPESPSIGNPSETSESSLSLSFTASSLANNSASNALLPRENASPEMATPSLFPLPHQSTEIFEATSALTEIVFTLEDFAHKIDRLDSAKAKLAPNPSLFLKMDKHDYVWINECHRLDEIIRAESGHIVRLYLNGDIRGNPNIEAFLSFRVDGEWRNNGARPGHSSSARIPANYEKLRVGLRLAGEGSIDNLRMTFDLEREIASMTRLEWRRRTFQTDNIDKRLKIALIADPFTYENFNGVTDIISIRPNTWRGLMELENPDFLFVESAWEGNNGAWTNQIVRNTDELSALINWCRSREIPTIFWNKEDPVHFHRFLPTAKLFDIVYTTCRENVAEYQSAGIKRVDVLPFGVNLLTYNPAGSGRARSRGRQAVFAGSYYGTKFAERSADLERLFDLTKQHGLRIFDRHAGSTGSEYAFPDRFQDHIVGSASARQLDREYKRSRIALNVNTVKDSHSMFARRVVEIAITGTPIVSNSSPALQNMFGDGVIASDDADEIRHEIGRLRSDDAYWNERRRNLLRTALMSHTIRDRLNKILSDLNVPIADPRRAVCLVILPTYGKEKPTWWHRMPVRFEVTPTLSTKPLSEILPEELTAEYVCIVGEGSNLEEGTIFELLRHHEYAQADIVGLTTLEQAFRYGAPVNPLAMIMRRSAIQFLTKPVSDISMTGVTPEFGLMGLKVFGVEDLGWRPDSLDRSKNAPETAWVRGWHSGAAELSVTESTNGFVVGTSRSAKATYVRLGQRGRHAGANSDPLVVANGQRGLALRFECIHDASNMSVELHVQYYNGKECTANRIINGNINAFVRAPSEWTHAHLTVRITGVGSVRFRVSLLHDTPDAATFTRDRLSERSQNGSQWLCVSSVYPRPSNIYRNAFVHTRALRYMASGKDVCVVSMEGNPDILAEYNFEGVQVFAGGNAALADVLRAQVWQRVLCHIVSTEMLSVLDECAPGIPKIVWVHAIEAERWYRRWFNLNFADPDVEQRVLTEIERSDGRTRAVREVYMRSGNERSDCRTIFVSDWFRRNVAVIDVRPEPIDYRVIHNPIDTSLFRPIAKQPGDRFRWLSIRPYVSRKYANDLTVAAILLLAGETWFSQVEITIVGQGALFDEILAPLRGLKNVTIINRFLLQSEIVEYHAQHGIFLCPTRHDSQGVSLGEAMSSGLVPVSNDCMAIPEFVPREWGLLAPPDDPAALADRIRRLVEDPELFVKLSADVASHIARKCGDQVVIPQEIDAITSGWDGMS